MQGVFRLSVLVLILVVALLMPEVARAATLTVELRNADGQGVGGADVTITNLGTGSSATGKTGTPASGLNGKAEFKKLEPGTYKVTVTKDGRTLTDYIQLGDKGATRGFIDESLITPPPGAKSSGDIFKDLGSWIDAYKQAALKAKHSKDAAGQKKAEDELSKIENTQDHIATRLDLFAKDLIKGLPAWVQNKLNRRIARAKTDQEKIDQVRATIGSIDKKIKKYEGQLQAFGGAMTPQARKALQAKIDANKQAKKDVTALGEVMEAALKHKKASQSAKDAQAGIKGKQSASKLQNPNPEEQSCFTAGTLVRMADGSNRAIEDLRIGDRVIGQHGAVNKVVGIERPRLGERLLYSFNGGRPFVTAEHPFMTARGWKSIDPVATHAENPALSVESLISGDRVVRIAADDALVTRAAAVGSLTPRAAAYGSGSSSMLAVHSITAVRADPATRVYNLLLDGNHTYFADGYLVHNKEAGDGGSGDGGSGP